MQTHDVTVVGPHDPIEQFVRVLPRLLADGFQHGGVLGTHQLLHGRQCCGRVAQVKEVLVCDTVEGMQVRWVRTFYLLQCWPIVCNLNIENRWHKRSECSWVIAMKYTRERERKDGCKCKNSQRSHPVFSLHRDRLDQVLPFSSRTQQQVHIEVLPGLAGSRTFRLLTASITNGKGVRIDFTRACLAATVVKARSRSTTSAVDASSSVDARPASV